MNQSLGEPDACLASFFDSMSGVTKLLEFMLITLNQTKRNEFIDKLKHMYNNTLQKYINKQLSLECQANISLKISFFGKNRKKN